MKSLLYLTCLAALANCAIDNLEEKLKNPAVVKFREYIRIDTSQSENIEKAVEFWRVQAQEVGLQFNVYSPAGKPVCVMTWPGTNPALPSIMLNSHMDVVPANPADWSHPPYAAEVDADGNIFGRGTQDTKDVGVQYLEAVKELKAKNVTLERTIHITLVPDEETGGFQGMIPFVQSPEFKAMNVGFAMDEGMAAPGDDFYAFYQDKRLWFMNFTIEGVAGHGSTMPDNMAIEKLQRLLNVIMEYRKPLAEAVKSKTTVELGEYTTLNINMIHGGVAANIIPETFSVVADMRLSPKENATQILELINSWVAYAGNGTKVEFIKRVMQSDATILDDSNPYWVAMRDTMKDMGFNVKPIICPATTDILSVRNLGIPAVGFATKIHTVAHAHAPNEYVNVDIFLQGIRIYEAIIQKLGNLPA